jgi:hypothetical protein
MNEEELKKWVTDLYDPTSLTDKDVQSLWEAFSYKGFNREEILKQLAIGVKDKRVVIELIIVGALRGPRAGSLIKLSNGKTSVDLGIPASGGQGSKILTLNKIVSATADLAAYYLKKMKAPKRIQSDLPGWLQFPSAGSIRLPNNLRILHLEFSKRFSTLIGGEFQETIYTQMENNSYLDERLNLF